MKIDMDKIIDALNRKLQINAEKLTGVIVKLRNILLLLVLVIAGIYLIKYENTRTWGIIVSLLSFAWLYAYVVKRRGTRKK